MASKSATTLASSPPKPSTVAPTSVWSLLGEQGFEASAFSNFFEPSVAEGKESIELPKGCGAHLLYGVAPHELSTAVQAYNELLSLKLAYHQPEDEEPSRRANTELGRLLRYHGDVKGLAALTDDSEFALTAYFNSDGQEDFVSHGDNAPHPPGGQPSAHVFARELTGWRGYRVFEQALGLAVGHSSPPHRLGEQENNPNRANPPATSSQTKPNQLVVCLLHARDVCTSCTRP